LAKYYTEEYREHHFQHKFQKAAREIILKTFLANTICCELDFSEKFKLKCFANVTCGTSPAATLMIALVHYLPFIDMKDMNSVDENGKHVGVRKYSNDCWIFVSNTKHQDAAFHCEACKIMKEHYKNLYDAAGADLKQWINFTDG